MISIFKDIFWIFDIFTHFRIHYIISVIALNVLFLFFRRFFLFTLSIISLFINLSFLNPIKINYFVKHKPYIEKKEGIRTMFYNIYWYKNNITKNTNYISEIKPDIVILAEVSPNTFRLYKERLKDFAYSNYSDNPNDDEPDNGIALFSKIKPENDIKIIIFEKWTCPSLQIDIKINGKIISVIGTHPYSPINKNRKLGRDKQFILLSDYIKNQSNPVLLIGDFNSTIWQKEFQYLVKNAELINSMDKFGLQPSWPASMPAFLRITIDHVLYQKEIELYNKFLGSLKGSDHLPVIADFSVR
ncbi:MAG: endonuclease/exonuclease/phosphatase family protein [Spirochaetes bacterium]|nr:endonuclease/exonuclease/phosphatase family protein [Spirochaetota bacterium]